jgi:hypothetical protein|tara:strand:- start:243 stop:557 length:315 start_codon:yes stop_codon:yes gene_type:complete
MARTQSGFIECPSITVDGALVASRKPVPFFTDPVELKSIWIQANKENTGAVSIGVNPLCPVLEPGESKEFIYRHDVKESPGAGQDLLAIFAHLKDTVSYIAITV